MCCDIYRSPVVNNEERTGDSSRTELGGLATVTKANTENRALRNNYLKQCCNKLIKSSYCNLPLSIKHKQPIVT